jgi:gluconate 2-dehydrogenase
MRKIVVTSELPRYIQAHINEYFDVIFIGDLNEEKYPEFLKVLPQAEGMLITADFRFTDEIFRHMTNVRGVSTIAAGFDNIPVNKLSERNILCTHTPDILSEATADLIFGLLLATARRIPELDRFVKDNKWKRKIEEQLFGKNVYGKKLGIIGLGSIGKAVARRAKYGFDMKIFYHNRTNNKEAEQQYGAVYKELDDLLELCDYICLTLPLTPESRKLIDINKIKKMKRNAIIINGGRGEIIVEEDLVTALENGLILAAGLDVYAQEPVSIEDRIVQLPNVVTLPHAGSATHETRFEMAKLAVSNLLNVLEGKSLKNVIKI